MIVFVITLIIFFQHYAFMSNSKRNGDDRNAIFKIFQK